MIVKNAKPEEKWEWPALAFGHLLFVTYCVISGNVLIALLWYGALLTTFMMFFRLRTWMEHQGSEGTHRIKLSWFEEVILAPHQSWHHYEHHKYPTVPYDRLHKVRELLGEDGIISLTELIKRYLRSPVIPSGKPLKN